MAAHLHKRGAAADASAWWKGRASGEAQVQLAMPGARRQHELAKFNLSTTSKRRQGVCAHLVCSAPLRLLPARPVHSSTSAARNGALSIDPVHHVAALVHIAHPRLLVRQPVGGGPLAVRPLAALADHISRVFLLTIGHKARCKTRVSVKALWMLRRAATAALFKGRAAHSGVLDCRASSSGSSSRSRGWCLLMSTFS